jgi:hypothetical protein
MKLDGLKSVLKRQVDYALNYFNISYDWITLSCARHRLPVKPGNLAIFTQTFNEGELLLYWESYYSKIVGHENLFVLNNGGSDDSCSRLNPKTNVINMPDGLVDCHNFTQIHGYFQRFLLMKYNWVLRVDVDELMGCEGGFIERLKYISPGIYSPEITVAVLHDKSEETSFNYDRSVFQQRANCVEDLLIMRKPSLASTPATWGPGNHSTAEKSQPLSGLWMVHLHSLDFDRLLQRNIRYALMESTKDSDTITTAYSSLKDKDLDYVYDYTMNEMSGLLSKPRVKIPNWLASQM